MMGNGRMIRGVRSRAGAGLPLFFTIVGIGGVIGALQWDSASGLFPLVLSVILIILAVFVFSREVRSKPATTEPSTQAAAGGKTRALGTPELLAWMGVFVVGLWFFGFVVMVPLFVCAFVIAVGRERIWVAVTAAGVSWAFVYGVAFRILHLSMPAGYLWARLL